MNDINKMTITEFLDYLEIAQDFDRHEFIKNANSSRLAQAENQEFKNFVKEYSK